MIAVFAYAFAHRKSRDVLVELALAGERDVCVIAAPFQKLPIVDRTTYLHKTLRTAPPQTTQDVASQLGFDYIELPHSDVDTLVSLVAEKQVSLGIIAGARILKRAVIEAFSEGIVNFHPGRIPETSGLDAFFYTIKTGVDAGVTTHFIDPRVDAGSQIYFDAVSIGADDTVEIVQENAYQLQIVALRRFLADRAADQLRPHRIDWPGKNQPMSPEEKWQMLLRFPAWRNARHLTQQRHALHRAAQDGLTDRVVRAIDQYPDLLEAPTPEGWTPLILAAYNQHIETVAALLARGANPNATGLKGTTVLMYAKTAVMDTAPIDTQLLDLLISHGADTTRRDMFGKGLLHYVAENPALTQYFAKHGATT